MLLIAKKSTKNRKYRITVKIKCILASYASYKTVNTKKCQESAPSLTTCSVKWPDKSKAQWQISSSYPRRFDLLGCRVVGDRHGSVRLDDVQRRIHLNSQKSQEITCTFQPRGGKPPKLPSHTHPHTTLIGKRQQGLQRLSGGPKSQLDAAG